MSASKTLTETIFEQKSERPAEVAVIITLYNYHNLVAETLESVLSQTLEILDLVVVDDRSTDQSLAVVREWMQRNARRFNRVKLLQHKRNQGLGITRNTAFRNTDTPFVFVLDADNLLYPTALAKLLKALKATDASFAFCYLEHFGDVQKIGGLQPWNPAALIHGNTIDAMVLMRKSTWEKVGGYSEDMPYNGWEDYELWFKIAKAGGWGLRLPEILCRYRVHLDSMLFSVTNPKVGELTQYLKKKHGQFWART